MSRSFERKVEKNRQKLQQDQKKKGIKPGTSLGSKGEGETFRGRNVLLPSLLVFLGLLYLVIGIVGNNSAGQKTNYTLTIITMALYLILAAAVFFRRPYLRIFKGSLFTSKYNRDKRLDANGISKIQQSKNSVVIVTKGKESNWKFSRGRNFFDTTAMGESLEQFAATHKIDFEKK
ncbi:hypothetical protein DCC85_12000 [Paenibacillus sp. CAA11]|uniref:hypothetical protein n=1 Tax=Paenibacillus sp. CAA11 TaxID=1532905 RepID=UPI000D33E82D|nr:hypothetical protein [Paenibacillus sp. CAA11]AWB44871.1 hypothetical protein DCC85_12000 [Paenibacillus sp. CAA11]